MTAKAERQKRGCCYRCCLGTFLYIFVLLLLLFLLIFVVAPLVFKYSPGIQRSLIFPTWIAGTTNFSNIEQFSLKGVRNFYVTIDEPDNVTLGVWQLLPNDIVSDFIRNEQYDYEAILREDKYHVLLYFHGNGGIRSVPLGLYAILRNYFHVIACDYRGYGDSSKAELTVDGVASDAVGLYKWVRERTKAKIFIWGHSLGTAVTVQATAYLKTDNLVPSGVILETPFSSVIDVMENNFIIKLYSWLPWYRVTLLDPMIYNGFAWNPVKYITDVDCPIMILHAKDDSVIPYEFATKLYEVAVEHRQTNQGNVTYHLWDALGYNHMDLYLAPELPGYISEFVDECIDFDRLIEQNSTKSRR